jgi:hypothetical protein
MKPYRGSGRIPPLILTSALTVGVWSASRPCRITLGEGGPCTNGIGDRVGAGDGVDDLEKKDLWIVRVYVLVNLLYSQSRC